MGRQPRRILLRKMESSITIFAQFACQSSRKIAGDLSVSTNSACSVLWSGQRHQQTVLAAVASTAPSQRWQTLQWRSGFRCSRRKSSSTSTTITSAMHAISETMKMCCWSVMPAISTAVTYIAIRSWEILCPRMTGSVRTAEIGSAGTGELRERLITDKMKAMR